MLLKSVRVLDITRVLAGPMCTMMLGDLGADVIKVERPGHGDETRGWGPPFDIHGESAYFLSVNRNKKSIALDLHDDRDVALVRDLIAGADIVVENFLPGALARCGLDADALVAAHPRLVWCTITGFGANSDRPGYDFVVQAEQGWMAITGEPGGAPMKHGVALADVIAGKDAAIAILGVLAARGLGDGPLPPDARRIIVSLANSALAALVNVAQNTLVSGQPASRWGNAHANLVPYQLFTARDQPIVIAVGNDAQWMSCARALGLDALAADPALATNAGRLAARQHVVATIAARVAERDAAAWIAAMERAGVPCGRVRSVAEALADAGASALTGVRPSAPGTVRLAPPRLDEHGAQIRELAWAAFANGVRGA